jgi:hypothetical protein
MNGFKTGSSVAKEGVAFVFSSFSRVSPEADKIVVTMFLMCLAPDAAP